MNSTPSLSGEPGTGRHCEEPQGQRAHDIQDPLCNSPFFEKAERAKGKCGEGRIGAKEACEDAGAQFRPYCHALEGLEKEKAHAKRAEEIDRKDAKREAWARYVADPECLQIAGGGAQDREECDE